jgi:hypothetical protein
MMMGLKVRVKTLRVPRAFNYLGEAYLLKSQQGTVDRV